MLTIDFSKVSPTHSHVLNYSVVTFHTLEILSPTNLQILYTYVYSYLSQSINEKKINLIIGFQEKKINSIHAHSQFNIKEDELLLKI